MRALRLGSLPYFEKWLLLGVILGVVAGLSALAFYFALGGRIPLPGEAGGASRCPGLSARDLGVSIQRGQILSDPSNHGGGRSHLGASGVLPGA